MLYRLRMGLFYHQLGVTPMWKRGRTRTDLKDQEGVVGLLFGPLPGTIQDYARFALTKDEISFYREKGWLLTSRPVFSHSQLDMVLHEVRNLISYEGVEAPPKKSLLYNYTDINPLASHQIFYSTGHWRLMRCLHDLIYLPALVAPASQLLGNRAVQFLHDELFCKPPEKGSCVVWHQNGVQWKNTTPLQHVTAHVAFDTQTEENGGLHVVTGSHLWRDVNNAIPMTVSSNPDPKEQMKAVLEALTEEEKEKFAQNMFCMKIPVGYALFMHPLLLHGSYPNMSSVWRRAGAVHYCAHGTTATATGPLFQGTYVMRGGEPLFGNFYPIVFSPHTLPGAKPVANPQATSWSS